MTPDQITAKVAAGYVKASSKVGTAVVFRRVTSTGGASPATNPVTGAITVATAALAGASSVTLTAPVGRWMVVAGDKFTVPGDDTVYTIGAQVIGTSTATAPGVFANVPISPALASDVAAGAAVTVTWLNDFPCRAQVLAYRAELIANSTVGAKDVKVRLPTTDNAGRTLPMPVALDKVQIGGAWRSIGIVQPEFQGAGACWFDCQAKG